MSLRLRALTTGLSLVGLMMAAPLVGQEAGTAPKPAADASTKPVRAGYDPARRVPPYFGQIGLTPEQREKVYAIKGKHLEKIDALKVQIEQLEKAMLTECEEVLTDVQKGLLRQRRDSAKSGRSR